MTIGLIAALDKEIECIQQSIAVEEQAVIYGSPFSVGQYHGHRIVAGCCSVGTVNAAVCASALIREWGADRIINIGIAGSLSKTLSILDLVVSDRVEFHDTDSDILVKYYPHRKEFEADPALVHLCTDLLTESGERFSVGKIASGDRFVNTTAQKRAILETCADALCVEMEGAAVGQVAHMNGTPFLVIRTISDLADDDADINYDEFIGQAAQKSARTALRLIEKLEVPQ